MSQIIALATQKGGEGKTTTSAALLSGLTLKGFKTLAIDLDAQCNLTNITGGSSSNKTTLELLTRECTVKESIQHTTSGDLIAANHALASIDAILQNELGKVHRLKKAIKPISTLYDYIIIDCPPTLSTLTANALTAASMVVIPAQADISSLQGIAQLWKTIQEAREYTNSNLYVAGILLTRYNNRTTLNREIEKQLKEDIVPKMNSKLYKTTIREAIAIKEAKYMQQSIFTYAPKSKVAADYTAFIEELLADITIYKKEGLIR